MNFEWLPEVLQQFNQYPNERFWGVLIIGAFVVIICTWLVSLKK